MCGLGEGDELDELEGLDELDELEGLDGMDGMDGLDGLDGLDGGVQLWGGRLWDYDVCAYHPNPQKKECLTRKLDPL